MPVFKRIGFTGPRTGMSDEQVRALGRLLTQYRPLKVLHGCCHGADMLFATMADQLDPRPHILGCPSDMEKWTSDLALTVCDEVRGPQPALVRNGVIVAGSDLLIATPRDFAEERRSGTWATVRAARRAGVPVVIVWPDGTVKEEYS